jgi:hypothetical protein
MIQVPKAESFKIQANVMQVKEGGRESSKKSRDT